jgi:wyosine [tRNA(Phe)-imidazoG37] synthetase (radical SAM superfamily)
MNPDKAYILVPTRPPAETDVFKPTAETLRNAYDVFRQKGLQPECITGDEGDSFYFTDDFVNDLLSISAVHPVREDVIINLLKKRGLDGSVIDQLVSKQMISSYTYEGKRFYKRNL